MKKIAMKNELDILSSGCTLIGAAVGLAAALLAEIFCGRVCVYALLLKPAHAPPAFLFYLLFTLESGLLGALCGMAFFRRCCEKRNIPVIVLSIAASLLLLLWYIAFFKTLSFFFALLLLLGALSASAFLLCRRLREGVLPFAFGILASLGLLWFLWFNIATLLLN